MALSDDFRIVAVNNTGVSIDSGLLRANIETYKGDGSGGTQRVANHSSTNASNSVPAGGSQEILLVTGSSAVGFVGGVEANLSANTNTPNGDVEFFYEVSPDGQTTFYRPTGPSGITTHSAKADDADMIAV